MPLQQTATQYLHARFSHGASFNGETEKVAIYRWLTDQFGSEKTNCLDPPACVRFQ